ncbi:MAG: DUF4411 family protein [Methanomassiliicoccales archaeon]|nr:MAG: DUF4411 family protein [Methanomassiliicoccales archaeon]
MIQTRLQEGFCIDTCALIDLGRVHYPPDVFPGVWADIESLVSRGLLIAPKEVFDELKGVDDEILKWARRFKEMFKESDEDQLQEVADILARFPGLIDPTKTKPEADPFLIALAKSSGWTVVTSERPRTSPNARPKIPDVCKSYGIRCISLVEFFRERGWKYTRVGVP